MGGRKFILDSEGRPREVDLLTWAKWFENRANGKVAVSSILRGAVVSTYFMGCEMMPGRGVMMFQSMVIGGRHNGWTHEWDTIEEARAGHEKIRSRLQIEVIGDEALGDL